MIILGNIIDFTENDTKIFKEFKAPPGKIFAVHSIMLNSVGAGSGYVMVINDWKLEEGPAAPLEYAERALILGNPAVMAGGGGAIINIFPDPHRTKFLTIAKTPSVDLACLVIINYSFKNASEDELIYEYLKKTI